VSGGALNQTVEHILAPVKKLPSELWPILKAIWVQPKFFEALASEMECLPESAAQVAASGAYGDMPLVVLSAGDAATAKTMEQEAVARLSSNGKIIVVPNSGHWNPTRSAPGRDRCYPRGTPIGSSLIGSTHGR
jgi:hypothetical protein